jgi:hypothetical protein
MTYLTIVNNILKRLRERTVATVNETSYSTLVGMLVNDAKQEIEQSWNWSALRTTLTATTTAGTFAYELTGSGDNLSVLDVINDTSNWFMRYQTASEFNNYYLNVDAPAGAPMYYSFNGLTSDGDTIVEVYPKPDAQYLIRFNIVDRTADLSADSDTLLVPSKPVEMLAYAKAVEERGEDGGIGMSSAYATAQRTLNDAISFDAAKHPEETIWTTV